MVNGPRFQGEGQGPSRHIFRISPVEHKIQHAIDLIPDLVSGNVGRHRFHNSGDIPARGQRKPVFEPSLDMTRAYFPVQGIDACRVDPNQYFTVACLGGSRNYISITVFTVRGWGLAA